MSLTTGSGPFGHRPAGRFNVPLAAEGLIYVEPSPRRLRALRDGETVLDTRRAKLVFEHAALPRLFFPRADVRWPAVADLEPVAPPAEAPGLEDHVGFRWGDLDGWLEEDERLGSHPIDPYHRVDVRRTSRRVVLGADGVVLADTARARALFETALPTRWYVPREDVAVDLQASDLRTECAYKGVAEYFSVQVGERLLENIGWTYREPRHDAVPVRDLVCFFDEALDVDVDSERQERPSTPWGRPGWWHSYSGRR